MVVVDMIIQIKKVEARKAARKKDKDKYSERRGGSVWSWCSLCDKDVQRAAVGARRRQKNRQGVSHASMSVDACMYSAS